MIDDFTSWLNSPECFNDLLPCARLVIFRAEKLGITLDDSYMVNGDSKKYQSAVASNLWQFIRENAKKLTLKASKSPAVRDEKWFNSFISQEFIDNCISNRRSDSPFHAYYRHMRTVLHVLYKSRSMSDFRYKPIPRKCSYFAWSQQEDLEYLPDIGDFRTKHLNYGEWSSSNIPFSEIHNNTEMIRLSRLYWDEALRFILSEYLLPIRELVSFIATKYPLIPRVEYTSDASVDEDDNKKVRHTSESLINYDPSFVDDSWTRQLQVLAQSIIEVDLDKIAGDSAAKLTGTEKTVLCELDSSVTLAEIAVKLGMKRPSNVSYYQKSAIEKLRTAWSLWSQPDSEHYSVAEDELRIFVKKVIEICKESNDCRDSKKEDRP